MRVSQCLRSTFAIKPICCAVLITCLGTGVASAQDAAPPRSAAAYYSMEGSGANASALNPNAIQRPNALPSDLRLPTSCEIWDHREDIPGYLQDLVKDYLEDKVGNGEKLIAQLVVAVAAAAELAVVAAMERALPSLYDFMTQINSGLEATLEISTQSCEKAVVAQGRGAGVLDSWYQVSTNIAWRDLMGGDPAAHDTSVDMTLNEAASNMGELAETTGIPWVYGQRAGEEDDKPIKVTEDVVREGFSVINGGASPTGPDNVVSTEESTVPGIGGGSDDEQTRLAALFEDSDAAVAFAVMVLGEEEVFLCRETDCDPVSTQGVGLYSAFTEESDKLIAAWNALLSTYNTLNSFPTMDDFETVSSESSKITLTLWRRLIDLEAQDRNAYISRLVSDIALENTVEKAMALRQMLLSGERAPEIQALGVVMEKTKRMSDLLLEAANVLISEVNIRGRLASNTAMTILQGGYLRDNEAGGLPLINPSSAKRHVLRDGAVVPE